MHIIVIKHKWFTQLQLWGVPVSADKQYCQDPFISFNAAGFFKRIFSCYFITTTITGKISVHLKQNWFFNCIVLIQLI